MMLALDTNIISYALKKKHGINEKLLMAVRVHTPLVIPPITYYETLRGLLAVNAARQLQVFEQFCLAMQMPDMGKDDWRAAAWLYAELKTKGRPMEDTDLLQAAFCLHHGYTLVTHNTDHFSHLPKLALTDWVKE
ncbi:MAG: PIN domain-containing protein [Treponema sp.]|jgi:tRNA(fMet)-specific endonuclease VapC|nr:PIN domain-containing protein [Treponema sp.]